MRLIDWLDSYSPVRAMLLPEYVAGGHILGLTVLGLASWVLLFRFFVWGFVHPFKWRDQKPGDQVVMALASGAMAVVSVPFLPLAFVFIGLFYLLAPAFRFLVDKILLRGLE